MYVLVVDKQFVILNHDGVSFSLTPNRNKADLFWVEATAKAIAAQIGATVSLA